MPVVAFSVGEEELRGIDTKPLVGHLAAWNYFMSLKNPANEAFIAASGGLRQGQEPAGRRQARDQRSDGSHVHRHQMWAQAVEQAHTTDVDAVRQAVGGQKFKAPSGSRSKMDAKNHHLHKPVFIGEVKADGQFKVVWKTQGPIRAQAMEPLHSRKREEGRRLDVSMGLRQLHEAKYPWSSTTLAESALTRWCS